MPLKLPRKNVAIKPFDELDFYDDSQLIIKPDTNKGRVTQGIVKFVSDKCEYCKIGDHVLFGNQSGTLIYVEGEGRLIIMSEDVIPCVIVGEDIEVSGLQIFNPDSKKYENVTISEAIEMIYLAIAESKIPYAVKVKEIHRENVQHKDY